MKTRGSALIEFAFGSTFLIAVLIGLFDAGRMFYYSDVVSGAVNAGIRQAARSASIEAVEQAAVEQGKLPGLQVKATRIDRPAGSYMDVVVQYRLRTLVHWPSFENPMPITGRGAIRVD